MLQSTEYFTFRTNEWEEFGPDIIDRYQWSLDRFIRENDIGRRGKIRKPTDDLGNGITITEILRRLSANSLFDFKYTPAERDSLLVSIKGKEKGYGYFTVIYINGKWQEGGNSIFTSETELIQKGFVEVDKS